jgi:23S rRNA maturation-related 3'-5' exoribonuclease YhaM
VWKERLPQWDGLMVGTPIEITAEVIPGWQGRAPELEVRTVTRLEAPVIEINPTSPIPLDELVRQFDRVVTSIERPEAAVLLDVVLRHERDGVSLWSLYTQAPAAARIHHSYTHGLLQHSLEVAEMCDRLALVEPYAQQIDRSSMLVAALVHDLGKIDEYTYGAATPIAVAPHGRLRSHISRGAELVGAAVSKACALEAGVVDPVDVDLVQHVIETHHGDYPGSTTKPRCPEATIVHAADLCSARLAVMMRTIETVPLDADHWALPADWPRDPVWHRLSALDRSTGWPIQSMTDLETPFSRRMSRNGDSPQSAAPSRNGGRPR